MTEQVADNTALDDSFASPSPSILRRYADALETFNTVKGCRDWRDGGDPATTVTWQWGAGNPSYKHLQKEVSSIVGGRLGALIAEAIDRFEDRAKRLRAEALGDGASSASTTDPAAVQQSGGTNP